MLRGLVADMTNSEAASTDGQEAQLELLAGEAPGETCEVLIYCS